jgi:hypothetical protein
MIAGGEASESLGEGSAPLRILQWLHPSEVRMTTTIPGRELMLFHVSTQNTKIMQWPFWVGGIFAILLIATIAFVFLAGEGAHASPFATGALCAGYIGAMILFSISANWCVHWHSYNEDRAGTTKHDRVAHFRNLNIVAAVVAAIHVALFAYLTFTAFHNPYVRNDMIHGVLRGDLESTERYVRGF